jgi:hypothetical protein
MTEQDVDIRAGAEPEAPTGTPDEPTTSTEGQGAPSTHYKTLEDADAAARRFQGERDQQKSQLDRLAKYGSVEQIEQFMDIMVPVSQKPDFMDYYQGKTPAPAEEPVDPYADPAQLEAQKVEQKRIGDLEQRINQTNSGVATLHFGREESRVHEDWGNLLEPYRDAAMRTFQGMVQNGAIKDPFSVNRKWIEDLYWQQVPLEDRPALIAKRAQVDAERRLKNQSAKGTTVPGPERSSNVEESPAKNLMEAYRRGKRDAEAREGRGG